MILCHGLLSTSALLDLLKCPPDQRKRIELHRRPEKVSLYIPNIGRVVIRDQKPMSDAVLRKVLTNVTPEDWYRLLNGKVFFWPNLDRLKRFLGQDSEQIVITVDTGRLLADHRESIYISHINSGATLHNARRRGPETFKRVAEFPFECWRPSRAVAEIAVTDRVVNFGRYATEVRRWRGKSPGIILWTPEFWSISLANRSRVDAEVLANTSMKHLLLNCCKGICKITRAGGQRCRSVPETFYVALVFLKSVWKPLGGIVVTPTRKAVVNVSPE